MPQPARSPSDGPINVDNTSSSRLRISVETDGVMGTIEIGYFNAWRLFAILALMLGVPLPKKLAKEIVL